MRRGYIIKNHLDKIGIEATLYDGEWNSMPFKCTVNPLWRKKRAVHLTMMLQSLEQMKRDIICILVRKRTMLWK